MAQAPDSASRKPLAAVLWIYGVYFSPGILFDAMDAAVRIASLGPQLTTLTYLGLTIASFWLIFRCIKGAQKKMQIRADRSPGILDKVLNSVFLYAYYTLPVEPLRQELRRLLDANPHWDRDVCVLQLTDSKPQSIEIRCLMSSVDAPTGWNLKCEIREGLVKYIQTQHPESLPRVRAELRRDAGKTDPMEMPATPQPTPVEECAF